MNEHKLDKAEELAREYYLHSKEYEKELEEEEITFLYNLNYNNEREITQIESSRHQRKGIYLS